MNSSEPSSGIAPLTPADCDLQDFQYMPLDVRRLRDSDLAAMESPEACWAAVLLWSASWHQVPAGSLPDDDRVLANLAGYGRVVKEWQRVKDGALRGWVKCEDGRLYHPVVAEKALEAWDSKLHHAHGKLKERLRKSYRKFRDLVLGRDGYTCVYCGVTGTSLQLDHVIPRSRGGADTPDNLVACCKRCNTSKGAKTPEEWMAAK